MPRLKRTATCWSIWRPRHPTNCVWELPYCPTWRTSPPSICINRPTVHAARSFFVGMKRSKTNREKLEKTFEKVRLLSLATPKARKSFVCEGNKEVIDCLSECCANVLKGKVPLTSRQKSDLCKQRQTAFGCQKEVQPNEEKRNPTEGRFLRFAVGSRRGTAGQPSVEQKNWWNTLENSCSSILPISTWEKSNATTLSSTRASTTCWTDETLTHAPSCSFTRPPWKKFSSTSKTSKTNWKGLLKSYCPNRLETRRPKKLGIVLRPCKRRNKIRRPSSKSWKRTKKTYNLSPPRKRQSRPVKKEKQSLPLRSKRVFFRRRSESRTSAKKEIGDLLYRRREEVREKRMKRTFCLGCSTDDGRLLQRSRAGKLRQRECTSPLDASQRRASYAKASYPLVGRTRGI